MLRKELYSHSLSLFMHTDLPIQKSGEWNYFGIEN